MDDASGSNPSSPIPNENTGGGGGDRPMAMNSVIDTPFSKNTPPAPETIAATTQPSQPQVLNRRSIMDLGEKDGGSIVFKCQAVQLPFPKGIKPFDISEYIELGRLGIGTCGRVCRVEHVSTKKLYVWKVLKVTDKDTIQKRTVRVMYLASTLNHPNIITCCGIWSGIGKVRLLYDCMARGIKGFHVTNEIVLASIGKDILEGLRFLKNQHVIHGDLKPSNILADFDGTIKLCDFAAGKNVDDDVWDSPLWLALDSIKYMSPETVYYKLRKEDCEATDIWSFGLCVLEFYLGYYPIAFDRMDLHSICEGIVIMHPPNAPPKSSLEFQDFIRLCLRREPDKRASIDQLLAHKFIVENAKGMVW